MNMNLLFTRKTSAGHNRYKTSRPFRCKSAGRKFAGPHTGKTAQAPQSGGLTHRLREIPATDCPAWGLSPGFAPTGKPGSNSRALFEALPGSALMVCLLVMAVLMTLGTGLLVNSRLFLQTHGLRKMTRLTAIAAENGIKQAWSRVEVRAGEILPEAEISPEFFQSFKLAPESSGLEIIRPLLEAGSSGLEDDFSGLRWETFTTAGLSGLYSGDQYLKATFGFNIKSTGRAQGFGGVRVEELKCELTLLAGHLPLNQVPALVNEGGIQKEALSRVSVRNLQPGTAPAAGLKTVSPGFIPDDALPLLARGLKLLKPGSLPNWLLRQALQLEPGNEPIPDGVYLVQDSLGPGGVYVQGELTRLLLGIDDGFQIVQFQQAEKVWLLRFNPSTARTSFIAPTGHMDFDRLPIPVIMINGRVLELAAGRPDGSGFLKGDDDDADTPAFLSGLKLTIVCSGKITLTSNLISDGLEWREGLPYLRSKQSQLIIWSTGKDFQSAEPVEGGISLLGHQEGSVAVEASLVAGGHGLSVDTEADQIQLIGSLAASSLGAGRAEIVINNLPEPPPLSASEPDLRVCSEIPLLHLGHIKILEWRPSK